MSSPRLNKATPLSGDRTEWGRGTRANGIPSCLQHHLWDLDRRWATWGLGRLTPAALWRTRHMLTWEPTPQHLCLPPPLFSLLVPSGQ